MTNAWAVEAAVDRTDQHADRRRSSPTFGDGLDRRRWADAYRACNWAEGRVGRAAPRRLETEGWSVRPFDLLTGGDLRD
jgi:hypothetical protein